MGTPAYAIMKMSFKNMMPAELVSRIDEPLMSDPAIMRVYLADIEAKTRLIHRPKPHAGLPYGETFHTRAGFYNPEKINWEV